MSQTAVHLYMQKDAVISHHVLLLFVVKVGRLMGASEHFSLIYRLSLGKPGRICSDQMEASPHHSLTDIAESKSFPWTPTWERRYMARINIREALTYE